MSARRRILFALISIFACMGASYRTTNFVVHAPNQQIAELVGKWAEHYRKEKAVLWLGKEMPNWRQPCPIHVRVTMGGPSGATSFNFDPSGRLGVMGQQMEIQGPLDRLINSVLPHEVTHTVFAHHFRRPVPRWADEGGSVLSEDDVERVRHDKLVRSILNNRQQIQMRTLLQLKEYPPGKVMQLYAQGYSITDYLVDRSNRQHFLNFLGQAMRYGWDQAVKSYYGHSSVEELEAAWLKHLRDTKGEPHIIEVAQNEEPSSPYKQSTQNNDTVVRLTVPPMLGSGQAPIIRAQTPEDEPEQPFGLPRSPNGGGQKIIPSSLGQGYGAPANGRPKYLPDYQSPSSRQGWPAPQPAQPQSHQPVPVQLGAPQFGPMPQGVAGNMSPVGFPR